MRNILNKITSFFRGRYGIDKLSYTLVILSVIFSLLGFFFLRSLFYVLNLAIYAVVIYRALSTSFVKRANENRAFLEFCDRAKSFIKLQKKIFKDRKTHVYRTCPKCKAVIRLPKKRGKHTVKCPKCADRFETKV